MDELEARQSISSSLMARSCRGDLLTQPQFLQSLLGKKFAV